MDNESLLKFNELEKSSIIPYLRESFSNLKSACCLYHMIEQYEDIYTYLVDGEFVITIEISREDSSISTDSIITIQEYAKMKKGKQASKYIKELLELAKRKDFQL
ncbi:hypothetical protein AB7W40_23540 [Providencia rettgeri]